MKRESPGLARLRAHPKAESVRQDVLRDVEVALEQAAARAARHGKPKRPCARLFVATSENRGRITDSGKITILVAKNPKRRTAAARFALYRPGMTVADYKAAVGHAQALADLRWDVKKQFARIT